MFDAFKDKLDSFKDDVCEAAVDTAGFVATTGGACASTVAHATAGGALAVADAATLGYVDSIGDAKDDHFDAMQESADNVSAGVAAFWEENDWFKSDPTDANQDWMSGLPDDRLVTDIFIPGTHESMAIQGGDLAECQKWHLLDQLMSGIRAFDIRLKHVTDDLPCYHGIIAQGADFNNVVETFENFLEEHPSEAIFARVRREGEEGEHSKEFTDEVWSRFRKPDVWLRQAAWNTIGEVRGKITFLAQGSHLKLYQQEIDLQDLWKTGDEEVKLQAIVEHAQKEREADKLYLGYCSATGMDGRCCYKGPAAMAYQVNGQVVAQLDSFNPGIYMFDFPGVALIEALLARNVPA